MFADVNAWLEPAAQREKMQRLIDRYGFLVSVKEVWAKKHDYAN